MFLAVGAFQISVQITYNPLIPVTSGGWTNMEMWWWWFHRDGFPLC